MQGAALPVDDADADARGFERVLTEWDSELFGVGVHLRTITRDGWVCTAYRPGYVHDGTEGELYDLADDPLQQVNRWDDPACASHPVGPRRRPLGEPARAPRPAPRRRGARLTVTSRRRLAGRAQVTDSDPARTRGGPRARIGGDRPSPPIRPGRTITGMSAVLVPYTADGAIDWATVEAHIARTRDAGLTPAVNMDTGYVQLLDPTTASACST